MKVTVRYMAQLRLAAGVAVEEVKLGEALSLVDLLRALATNHGPALERLLLAGNGTPQPTLLAFVGDDQADWREAKLKEGDSVTLLSPIAGG